jgi:hypothetical protein
MAAHPFESSARQPSGAGTGTRPFRKASRDGNVTIIQINHPTPTLRLTLKHFV